MSGQDQFTDFLCLSYSTPDIAGHAFGPYSRELEDMYARLDRELQRLFASLETRYGKDGFVLFLTADHAVVPVPEMLVKMKLPGGYFFLNDRLQVLRFSLSFSCFSFSISCFSFSLSYVTFSRRKQ